MVVILRFLQASGKLKYKSEQIFLLQSDFSKGIPVLFIYKLKNEDSSFEVHMCNYHICPKCYEGDLVYLFQV